jgi:hypothetical protein
MLVVVCGRDGGKTDGGADAKDRRSAGVGLQDFDRIHYYSPSPNSATDQLTRIETLIVDPSFL